MKPKNNTVPAKVIVVMLDLITGQADDQTIQQAAQVEHEAPEVWRENQWLRMTGGTPPGGMDKDWQQYLTREMDEESER